VLSLPYDGGRYTTTCFRTPSDGEKNMSSCTVPAGHDARALVATVRSHLADWAQPAERSVAATIAGTMLRRDIGAGRRDGRKGFRG
jgi:hypothetical protein